MWEAGRRESGVVQQSGESAAPMPRSERGAASPPSEGVPPSAAGAAGTAGAGGRADSWSADAGLMSAMGLGSTAAQGAEYGGGGGVRAHIGELAEGAHPGIKRGAGGKRRIGVIEGGTFVPGAATKATAPDETAAAGKDSERAFVGARGSGLSDRTTNDGATKVRMENETDAQALVIAAAITRARQILDNALSKIASPSVAKVDHALRANFQSNEAKVTAEVTSKLQKIRGAFNGTIPIEVESEGDARAYVYVIWSDIHLCPPWFADTDPDGRARTIIHECSHKYTGTDDKAYHWDTAKYASLSPKDALNNADSFAWFCIDVL